MSNTINSPLRVTLQGGMLDGDTFELIPNGSVLPPMRLSYAFRSVFEDNVEYACWLNYECEHVPEWTEEAVIYVYSGKEKM